jgi:hypothetical protein
LADHQGLAAIASIRPALAPAVILAQLACVRAGANVGCLSVGPGEKDGRVISGTDWDTLWGRCEEIAMRKTLQILACAGATLFLLTAAASAQDPTLGISPFKPDAKRPLTQDEVEKQQKLDDDYKAATKKIPDQKANDPWAVVRPSSSTPAPKKKTQ